MTATPTRPDADPHADKYNDPRVKITRRGILMGVAVAVLSVVGAGASIYARKTPLKESTAFWGQETIMALQIGERIELRPRGNETFDAVDLTSMPSLGLLRRAILDSRNYDWQSVDAMPVASTCTKGENDTSIGCIQLRLTDPTGHRFDSVEIDINLHDGWIGPSDGSKRVRTSEHLQRKLRNYFATVIHVKQRRYDHRD